ncbi:MAG: FAD-binding oxidoreductase [Rhodoluna sp.]|nr:FAD-binding oxidoreductase [Rhodoluna sp.]
MKLTSFGGLTATTSGSASPAWEASVNLTGGLYLPTGMGRSYGDSAIVDDASVVSSLEMNKFLSFDSESGVLVCEPGVLLRDIQETFVKQGWMLHVTPGTAMVTVGGAVANDIHGKDHHLAGTFGEHVLSFILLRSDGEQLHCSATENSDFFRATIGGLGLTGFITSISLQLKKVSGPYFDTEVIPYSSLSEFFELSSETEDEGWQASVSWFDCSTSKAGRGSFTRGNVSSRPYDKASTKSGVGLAVPFTPPISLVNKFTLDVFNAGYFQLQKSGAGKREVHYKEFYYPLDGVGNWNRIYGPKGFFQYQSVIPMEFAQAATEEMLEVIKRSGQGSFLAVLKTFADRKPAGLLSFARYGVTLALDFPNRGAKTESLMQSLDRIVAEAGGAINPSKDARMSRELFASGFPGLEEFKKYRDPNAVSNFSRRVID